MRQLKQLIYNIDIFKKQRILQTDDIRQITKYLSYTEYKEGELPVEHGEPAENLYIILRGKVQFYEPNLADIPDWEWAW